MLRAERMSDCIFNGTAKRPPMGISEVTLTLVDPELSDAVAKAIDGEPELASLATAHSPVLGEDNRAHSQSPSLESIDGAEASAEETPAEDASTVRKFGRKRHPEKPSV